MEYFTDTKNLMIKLVLCNHNNNILISTSFKINDLTGKIKINDILIINNGDKVPTDGIIISGDCLIDESMITGESIPINKTIGAEVIGGTIIKDGNIKIKASKIGNDTVLSQIIDLVKNVLPEPKSPSRCISIDLLSSANILDAIN